MPPQPNWPRKINMKKFSEIFREQYREKGRFKPTVPHNVSNVPNVTPRSTSDSADVKLRERCWTGYRQIGMKKKGNKMVPNCISEDVSGKQEMQVQGTAAMTLTDKPNKEPMKKLKEASAAAIAAATAIAKKKSGNYDKEGMRVKPYKNPDAANVKSNAQRRKEMNEDVKKSDIPAILRKKRGDKPLTLADLRAARKDSISHPENLAKARNEEVVKEGAVPAKEKTVMVRHKTSGKELVVTVSKAKQLQKYDYHPVKEEVEKHKEIYVHTDMEDGSHQDKNDTKALHDRIKAAAKKHGASITYQDKPSLRGSHSIAARGSHEFHKEVKHIASDYEHLGAQHEVFESVELDEGISDFDRKEKSRLFKAKLSSAISASKPQADKLLARTGMNLAHKFPRKGQTNLGNIPIMNTPGNSPETDAFAKKRREDRAKQLKPAIRAALGKIGRAHV